MITKGINFLQSMLNIKDKGILNALQDIPLFENGTNLVRVNNSMVIAYIARKFRAEYLWQRYLNFIVLKYFFNGIFKQYKEYCTHDFFHLCITENFCIFLINRMKILRLKNCTSKQSYKINLILKSLTVRYLNLLVNEQ